MNKLIDKDININLNRNPKWQMVKKFIISHMSSGDYLPGDALPSENMLCEQVGVARSTVRQAFNELEREGYIIRIQGKGTFFAEFPTNQRKENTKVFGLILINIREAFYASLTQGFDNYLSEMNLQTLICDSKNDVSRQGNLLMQLLHKNIDGVAMVAPNSAKTPDFQIQLLLDNNIPVVLCHRAVEGVSAPVLMWDREQVGRLAGKFLIENGHKDIGYFGVYKYEITDSHIRGLKKVMNDADLELGENRIYFGPMGDEEDKDLERERILAQILLSSDRPTAIMCNNETEAERLFWLAYRMGIKVPEDLSIIGFGDSHRNTVFRKMLTSVVIDELELGAKAARILCEIKNGKRSIYDSSVEFLDLDLYEGKTVANVN